MVACNTSNPHHTQSPQSDVQYATQHCHGAAKSFLINNAFSTMIKLSIASLITHLLAYMAYTGCIAEWMAFAWRHFAHKKQYKKSTHYEVLSMAMSPYSMFINDIIIRAVNVHGKNQKICGQITAKNPPNSWRICSRNYSNTIGQICLSGVGLKLQHHFRFNASINDRMKINHIYDDRITVIIANNKLVKKHQFLP